MSQAYSPAAATLAGIPSEARLEIFKFLLQSDQPISITFNADGHLRLVDDEENEAAAKLVKSLGVLPVSQSIFATALMVLYGENKFVMRWTEDVASITTINMCSAKNLRHLDIQCKQDYSPTFGLARFINILVPGAAEQLTEITITFDDEVKLLACVAELTKAVTTCGSLNCPILEVVVSPEHEWYKKPLWTNWQHDNLVSTLRRQNSTLNELLELAESDGNDNHMFFNYTGPNFKKIKIVGPIAKEFLPKFEAHTCEAGHCEMKNLSTTQAPATHVNAPITKDPRRYVWAKKTTTNALPEVNMRQWLPRMPKEYAAELFSEFNMTMEELYQ